jgi:hypothetical protein
MLERVHLEGMAMRFWRLRQRVRAAAVDHLLDAENLALHACLLRLERYPIMLNQQRRHCEEPHRATKQSRIHAQSPWIASLRSQ